MADEKDREIQYLRREIEALKTCNAELQSKYLNAFEDGWKKGAAKLAKQVVNLCEVWTIWGKDSKEVTENGIDR